MKIEQTSIFAVSVKLFEFFISLAENEDEEDEDEEEELHRAFSLHSEGKLRLKTKIFEAFFMT